MKKLFDLLRGRRVNLVGPHFLHPHDIAKEVESRLPEAVKYDLVLSDSVVYHHTLGKKIRNEYGLWLQNNPHTRLSDPGCIDFPDQVSDRIIQHIQSILREKKYHEGHPYQPYAERVGRAST